MMRTGLSTAWLTVACGLALTPVMAAETIPYSIPPAAGTQREIGALKGVGEEILPGFYPAVTVSMARHNNALRSDTGEQSDTVITVAPSLLYKTELGKHALQLRYEGQFYQYQNLSSENVNNHVLNADLGLDLTEKFDVNLNAGLGIGSELRGASGSRTGTLLEPDTYRETRWGAEAVYGRSEAQAQVVGSYSSSQLRYTNNDQEQRDRDTDTIGGKFLYNIGPKTALLVEAKRAQIGYLHPVGVSLDSSETALLAGVTWAATAKTTGEFKAGRLTKDFDDPARGDYSGLTYLGRVQWAPLSYSRFSLYASQRTEETTDLAASYFVSRLLGLGWDHELTSRMNLFAYINAIRDDYDSGREDKIRDYGVGLNYNLLSWLDFSGRYGRVKRDSSAADASYEDQFFLLSLTASRK